MEQKSFPGNLTQEEWENNLRLLEMLDRWDAEDAIEEADESAWPLLQQALEADHFSSRTLFPTESTQKAAG